MSTRISHIIVGALALSAVLAVEVCADDSKVCVPVPEAQLPAPKVRFPDGQEVSLHRDLAVETVTFRALAGSPGEGLTVKADWLKAGGGFDYSLELTSTAVLKNIQVVQEIKLDLDWRSYVIAPGAIYQGNRFLVSPQPYCPYLLTEGVGPDGPIVVADVPRLTADRGYRTEMAANALTIPAVGIYDSARHSGYLVGVEVYGAWGVTGINLATLPGENVAVAVCLPVRPDKRYRFCDWVPATERGMDLKPGATIKTRIHFRPVAAANIPAFVARMAEYGHETRGREPRRPNLSFARLCENSRVTVNE